jgi:transposase
VQEAGVHRSDGQRVRATVALVGIEGTGSYGAGLARHVAAAGIRVVEVDRSDRQDRRRQGKSDPLDAVSAARAAQSGRARGAPKGRDGAVEAIRALMAAKRSARSERTQTINQARSLIVTGPDDLRARFAGHTVAALVSELAALRPRPGDAVGYATRIARAPAAVGSIDRLISAVAAATAIAAPGWSPPRRRVRNDAGDSRRSGAEPAYPAWQVGGSGGEADLWTNLIC